MKHKLLLVITVTAVSVMLAACGTGQGTQPSAQDTTVSTTQVVETTQQAITSAAASDNTQDNNEPRYHGTYTEFGSERPSNVTVAYDKGNYIITVSVSDAKDGIASGTYVCETSASQVINNQNGSFSLKGKAKGSGNQYDLEMIFNGDPIEVSGVSVILGQHSFEAISGTPA